MSNKILLAVDEKLIEQYIEKKYIPNYDYLLKVESINNEQCVNIEQLHEKQITEKGIHYSHVYMQGWFFNNAKADAEAYIAEIKKETAREIFKELDDVWFVDVLDEPAFEQLKAKYIKEKL